MDPDVLAHLLQPPKPPAGWEDIRDISLFLTGLVLTIREAVFTSADRPDLLVLYAAMMGLPAYLIGARNGKKK